MYIWWILAFVILESIIISWPFNHDIITWKHILPYWSFVRGIYPSLSVDPHHKRPVLFSLFLPEQIVEQTVELPVILNTMTLMWSHWYVSNILTIDTSWIHFRGEIWDVFCKFIAYSITILNHFYFLCFIILDHVMIRLCHLIWVRSQKYTCLVTRFSNDNKTTCLVSQFSNDNKTG